jgi:hypothetical protein
MKGNITLGMLIIAISTSAQIQNGSFESGGVFNTNGWTPTACAVIGSTTDAPDGDHALVMASSSVNVCNYAVDSNRLVQVLPWVNDGDLLRLQWWWHKGAPNEYAIAWLGTVENGTFTSQYSFTTSANNWAMFTMDEEIQVGPGQQAALALGGGFALQDGGSSYFDMIEVSLVTGLAEDQARLPMRPNPVEDILRIDATGLREFVVFDISGAVRYRGSGSRSTIGDAHELDVERLPAGTYILEAHGLDAVKRARFIKR